MPKSWPPQPMPDFAIGYLQVIWSKILLAQTTWKVHARVCKWMLFLALWFSSSLLGSVLPWVNKSADHSQVLAKALSASRGVPAVHPECLAQRYFSSSTSRTFCYCTTSFEMCHAACPAAALCGAFLPDTMSLKSETNLWHDQFGQSSCLIVFLSVCLSISVCTVCLSLSHTLIKLSWLMHTYLLSTQVQYTDTHTKQCYSYKSTYEVAQCTMLWTWQTANFNSTPKKENQQE